MSSLPYSTVGASSVIDWSGLPAEQFGDVNAVNTMVSWVRTYPHEGNVSVSLPPFRTPSAYKLRHTLIAMGCTVRLSSIR